MTRIVNRLLCCILIASGLLSLNATAQQTHDRGSPAARANAGTVGVISGGIDGTYVRIAADLAAVLDDGQTLRVLPILGKGSLQNIADILYLHGVDIGIVQSDALAYVKQRHLYPSLDQAIQYIAKLYDEEVHVLTLKDVARIEDLAGHKVNVDVAGSGTAMTASVLFDALGIAVQTTNFDQATALEKLRQGELAGIVFVTGQPSRIFSGVPSDTGLHFISVPLTDALASTYLPAELTHASYPALVEDGVPVQTVAVGSVMAVFAWQQNNERYAKVARFIDAFFSKFPQLLQPPRHPKWKDVNLAAKMPGWIRFAPAEQALVRQVTAGNAAGSTREQFNAFVSRTGVRSTLTDAQKEALFRQFLDWENRGKPPR